MAYTERYVTDAASGGNGTQGSPWTLAESLTNAVGGDRVNIQSDSGYSLGADVVDGTGTIAQYICFRGYNSSIGDLENTGWNADGTLDTTGFPIITLTGALTFAAGGFQLFQNLSFTAGINSVMVGGIAAPDNFAMIECKVINTANNASAQAVRADNDCQFINCDLECSGAAHGIVLDTDATIVMVGCRIKGVENGQILCEIAAIATVVGCVFIGSSTNGIGLSIATANTSNIIGNTFYDLDTAIQWPNLTPVDNPLVINNHATDNGEWLNNLNSGTANVAVLEVNNRTRDNTTPRTGIGDGANIGEVTTDTGGDTTDYTNPSGGDLTLISGAPGKATGMRQYTDIGGLQRQEAGSASGVRNPFGGPIA